MSDMVRTGTVTVGAGASLSGAVTMDATWKLVAVITDSAWDTNAMTFQATVDGTNYFSVYNEGTEYSLAGVVASALNRVDLNVFLGARAIKVRSGTAASAVNQVDATVVTLVFFRID